MAGSVAATEAEAEGVGVADGVEVTTGVTVVSGSAALVLSVLATYFFVKG